MYSPKIKEDLIPKLYKIAKKRGVPMTELVNNIVREAIENEYSDEKSIAKTCSVLIRERITDTALPAVPVEKYNASSNPRSGKEDKARKPDRITFKEDEKK